MMKTVRSKPLLKHGYCAANNSSNIREKLLLRGTSGDTWIHTPNARPKTHNSKSGLTRDTELIQILTFFKKRNMAKVECKQAHMTEELN